MISPDTLTDLQISVLRKTQNGVHYYDDLSPVERSAADFLLKLGFCYVKEFSEPVYRITEAGKSMLTLIEKEANKQAENKRQQRLQNQFSVASILVPLVTFILGLIVEHFTELVSCFLNIFR